MIKNGIASSNAHRIHKEQLQEIEIERDAGREITRCGKGRRDVVSER